MWGAALVTGLVFGALAAGKSSDYDDLREKGGVYDDLKEISDSGQQYETLQIALIAAGGVIAAAGGGLLIWELLGGEDEGTSTSALIMPTAMKDGAGFAASLSF